MVLNIPLYHAKERQPTDVSFSEHSKRSIAFIFKIFGLHLCLKAFHKLHDNALTIPSQPSLDCLSEPVWQDVSILPDKVSKGRVQDICLCPIFLRPYGPSISLYQFQCCLPIVPLFIQLSFRICPSVTFIRIRHFGYNLKPR